MTNPNSNLPHESYTSDYLDSVKARFPEFSQLTRQELIENLEVNKDRKPGEYEFLLKDALENASQEALLNSSEEALFTYLFEELPPATSEELRKIMTGVITGSGKGDIILGSWTEPRKNDFDAKIGGDANTDNYNFLHGMHTVDIRRDKQKCFMVILRVKKMYQQDAYKREYFSVLPELIEIPDQGSMTPRRMIYKKELTVAELKESFAKCITANN